VASVCKVGKKAFDLSGDAYGKGGCAAKSFTQTMSLSIGGGGSGRAQSYRKRKVVLRNTSSGQRGSVRKVEEGGNG